MWIARQGKLSNAWSSAPSRGRHTRCLSDWSSDVCSSYPSRRRHTRCLSDWSSDVCSSDLPGHQKWNDRWVARGTRDDVEIVVVITGEGRIWTGWPNPGGSGVIKNPEET